MTIIYRRSEDLRARMNNFLQSITGTNISYFDTFTPDNLIKLKTALSDINNVMTLKLTLACADWVCDFFNLTDNDRNELIERIENTKPNSNGYDIVLEKCKTVIEIKCTVPINGGQQYGPAQWGSILKDAVKLEKGIRGLPDTTSYFKIICLLDLGINTDQAIDRLIREVKRRTTESKARKELLDVVERLRVITTGDKKEQLSTHHVYIRPLKLILDSELRERS
ncbi:hypothetical protein [Geomonas ferrireducens]|uniref:hypothetical protein n=1 Tax=Geomonas ferrireducens TaxID=2570227 RepID=UPI0010A7B915|nr:hypothetical protein [Geomonas ferrireducens]